MLSPARLTQILVEFVFLLLGALVTWLGLSGHIYFDRRGTAWLIVALALILWGLLAFAKSSDWLRWQKRIRGGSLVLLGLIMLAMTRVPFLWVGKLLALAGVVLVVRGLAGIFLILRQR